MAETRSPPVLGKGRSVRNLEDGFGRRFHYLRLSVTEACNYRCAYCLPNGYRKSAPHDFLSAEEVTRLVRAFQHAGVRKVRLTGGEPSTRRDLTAVIAAVSRTGVQKLAMTTNGWSLVRRVGEWADAGLTHLNVSVDSLDGGIFARVTGHDDLAIVLEGVESAVAGHRICVKLNVVLLRDTLDTAFDVYADYVRQRPISVRFIELMRTGDNAAYFAAQHVSGEVLRAWLLARGWAPVARATDAGPAAEFVHPDYAGRFGIIAPYAPGFCDSCNRLRVTARGKLRLCLFGEGGVDLRDLLQRDEDQAALLARISAALGSKPLAHRLHSSNSGDIRQLAEVGG